MTQRNITDAVKHFIKENREIRLMLKAYKYTPADTKRYVMGHMYPGSESLKPILSAALDQANWTEIRSWIDKPSTDPDDDISH